MTARRVARLAGAVVLLAAGFYFLVYLWRWEWNRAVVAGIIFLAVEIGLATASVLDRIRSLGTAGDRPPQADPRTLATLRDSAPPARDHFAWLSPRNGSMGVFVPVLMGMGVVVSALAWVVERIARRTARPVLEQRLAARLSALAWPDGGLAEVPGGQAAATALLSGPVPR